MAQFVDVFIDRGIFFDVRIRTGHVGFGLIVIVIANKIFHGIVRKQADKLIVELCRQRFVGGQDQRWPMQACDHRSHGVRLTRPSDPEQGLMLDPILDAAHQLYDRLRLIACGLKFGDEFKSIHDLQLYLLMCLGSMQISIHMRLFKPGHNRLRRAKPLV